MKTAKGFTLLEVAVVLAVIAILAAMLTPIVTSYIDQARVTRANSDVKKIAESVLLYKRDTGVYPGFGTLADARTTNGPFFTTSLASCLVSGPSTSTTLSGWTCAYSHFLEAHLNVNSIGVSGTNVANNIGGNIGYRGPYLDGLSGLDPWGNPYVVNSAGLSATATTRVFAISAGPNGVFDTTQSSATPPAGTSDDIFSLIK